MDNCYRNFLSSLRILFRIFVVGVIILFLSRVVFLSVYGNFADLQNYWSDLLYSFAIGFTFDAKVLTFGLLPLALLCLTQLLNRGTSIKYGFYYKASLLYGSFLLVLFTLISIIDFYFFKFFNTRISVLFFGIVEDDTKAVLKSVWTDFPVVLIALSLIIFSVLLYFLLKRFFKAEVKWVYVQSTWLKVLFVFFFLGIYFLGLRGTISMKPLDVRHATISKNTFINTLTLNGIFSLRTAYSDKMDSRINTDIPQMLKRYGFNTPEEAITNYLGRPVADSISLSQNLLSTTPQDSLLTSNPPNVVFVLMESMNGFYFDLDSPEMNLMGKLKEQLPDCYVFRNFLSISKGTIYSLEGLLAGSPMSPISQSVYQDRSLSSSVAKPFKEHGYSTAFITGGEMGWRSLDKFIYHQYFDNVEGKETIKKLYPKASTCEWGVHDEYMFKRIFQLLSNANGKPQFVVGFTISNHTPYIIPESYKQYPLTLTDEIKTRLKSSPEIAHKNLLVYQYANNCLGQFIEDIKKSPLGENTIVVATGDHTNNQLLEFTDKDLLRKYSIPLILYVPPKYRPSHGVNTNRFGSHKDVFPTIFNLSLSNATYLNTGCNLLSADKCNNFGLYCFYLAMDSTGCVDFQSKPLFYRWESNSSKTLMPINGIQESRLDSLLLKARAYIASMNYYIMSELKSKKIGK